MEILLLLFFFFLLRFNFVTAFHFHYKAAKLYNAGLIFEHFIYVALQEYKNIFNVTGDRPIQRRPGLLNKYGCLEESKSNLE